jgi:superfamily II DNA or RNA helicase
MQLTSGSISRRPAASGPLQLTWTGHEAFAWQPGRSTSRWNQLATELAMVTGIYPSGGYLATRSIPTPDGPVDAQGYTLPPAALLELPAPSPDATPSVRWFCALNDVVLALLLSRRVVPEVHFGAGDVRTGWRPVIDDAAASALDRLDSWRPPVCVGVSSPTTAVDICNVIIDDVVDGLLRAAAWRAELPGNRDAPARVVRVLHKLLDGRQPLANLHDPNERRAATQFGIAFDRIARRGRGEPVIAGRLRLSMPTDPADPWPLEVEVVDVANPELWCTGDDIAYEEDAALAVAKDAKHLPLLSAEIDRVCHVTTHVMAGGLFEAELDGMVLPLDLDEEETYIDLVPQWDAGVASVVVEGAAVLLERIDALAEAGVEMIVPAQLARRSPSVSATATPTDATPSGRLGRDALVAWNVDVEGTPVDEEVIRKALEAGSSLVQIGGRWVRLDAAAAKRALAAVAEHRAVHSEMSTIALLRLAADLDAEAEVAAASGGLLDMPPPVRAGAWLGQLLNGLPDESLDDGAVPDGFDGTLRHYQQRGLGWLQFLDRVGLGGCLADDMGLGKTPTTLAHLAGREGPHLVVCPLSVVRNWQKEAARFTPLLRVLVHHGAGRGRDERLANAIAEADIVVTTYQLLVRDLDTLAAQHWGTVVFDEAQAVKNPHTKAARAARHLTGGQILALTGTPVENRLGELWSILDLTTPGLLGSESSFKVKFANPIERERNPKAVAALRTLTSPFVLRRTKADRSLVPDLPDKIEQVAWAPLTREQAAMYQGVVDQLLKDAKEATGMRRRGLVLASLTRLKQICNHPAHALGDGSKLDGRSGKLTRFDELVDDLLEADERALVFTQFRTMGDLLVRHLQERIDLHAPFLHGGVPKAKRDAMVDRFQAGEGSPLLFVSLKAGGTGLNLTAASRVVHYDRWWNPAVEDQATDRAWRIGQTRSVFVHKLVCQGTIEEKVAALIDDKRALADAVVGSTGENWLSELSTDELRDLIALDPSARDDGTK